MRALGPLAALSLVCLLPLSGAQPGYDPAKEHGYDPADPRNLSWVGEGTLAVGGGGLTEDDVRWLHAQGFGAIASFRGEHRNPEALIASLGMEHLWIPIEHGIQLNLTQLETFLAWADEMEAQGRKIYIHCTNGWHRGGMFAAAWQMRAEGLTFAEAAAEQVARRPGSVLRAPQAMLELEAKLQEEPGLTVLLLAEQPRTEPGEEMRVTIEARLPDGAPAVGAQVRFWTEESRHDVRGVTGADGTFSFDYRAPKAFMDHIYAMASLDGYTSGADQLEIFYQQPARERGELRVEHALADDALHVRVFEGERPVRARVLATAAGYFATAVVDEHGASLPRPPAGAEVELRAERWGSEGARVALTVPQGAAPAPEAASAPTQARDEGQENAAPPPSRTSARTAAPAAGLAATMLAAAALLRRRMQL